MAIENQYDGEVVDGATKFQKREIAVSTQSTDKLVAHMEADYGDTHQQGYNEVLPTSQKYAERQVYQVDQDSTEAAYRKRNGEVDRIVTKVDIQPRLPGQTTTSSQCRVPMTAGRMIYSTEHADAMHRAQTALAHLILVSITILEELTCYVSTNETTHN